MLKITIITIILVDYLSHLFIDFSDKKFHCTVTETPNSAQSEIIENTCMTLFFIPVNLNFLAGKKKKVFSPKCIFLK